MATALRAAAMSAALLLVATTVAARPRSRPTPPRALDAAARAAVERKDYPAAIELLRKLVKRAPTAKSYRLLGDVASWAGKKHLRTSIAAYRRAMALAPHDRGLRLKLATVLSWSKARKDRLEALTIYDTHLTFRADAADVLLRRARVRYWVGWHQLASEDFLRYLQLRPAEHKVRLELARVLAEMPASKHGAQRAIKVLDAYLARHPKDENAHLLRGRAWARLKRPGKALADYNRYLRRHPNDVKARAELALALSSSRDRGVLRAALAVYDDQLRQQPGDKVTLLRRCRVYTLLGETNKAASDASAYVAANGDSDKAKLEVAAVLSWSKKKDSLAISVRLYDAYLRGHPDDKKVFLRRLRVLSWAAREKEALAALYAYKKRWGIDGVELEFATRLSWSRDQEDLRRAIGLLDRYLHKNPLHGLAMLKRARVRSWLGQRAAAIADYERYLRRETRDDKARLELARLYTEQGELAAAIGQLGRIRGAKRSLRSAVGRARLLRWAGRYARAEALLERVRSSPKLDSAALRKDADVELAQVYAATGRVKRAVALLDDVIARFPTDVLARRAHGRISARVRHQAVRPSFFAYGDGYGNLLFRGGLFGRLYLHPDFSITASSETWRLGTRREASWAQRADVGARFAPALPFELEASAGARLYELRSPWFAVHARARLRVGAWLQLSAGYSYDDIYPIYFQPASLAAQLRAHSASASARLSLPWRIVASGEGAVRVIDEGNVGFDLQGSVTIPFLSIFSGGYYGRLVGWTRDNPSFWSPTRSNQHALVLRVRREFSSVGLTTQLQLAGGIGAERVEGVGQTGIRPLITSRLLLRWAPAERVSIEADLDVGYVPRLAVDEQQGGTSSPTRKLRLPGTASYWWLAPSLAVVIRI